MSLDGGNLGTHRESAGLGGAFHRIDYFSEFADMRTDNAQPNNRSRNDTYAGRFGVALGHASDLSGTARFIDRRFESPNGLSLYGASDDAFQTFRTWLVGLTSQTQITDKWQSTLRFASWDGRSHYENPTLSGSVINGFGYGDVVTMTGANGYSVTGRGILDYGPSKSDSRSSRQGVGKQAASGCIERKAAGKRIVWVWHRAARDVTLRGAPSCMAPGPGLRNSVVVRCGS